MSRFAARFFAALLCIGASAGASASTFTAGTGAGLPGSVVNIQLSISGDGLTHAAEMVLYIDGARLGFTSPPGPIPGAGQAGQCGWNGGNRVGALVFSPMAPLPSGNSIICTLPILIHENASPGRVALRIGSQRCVDGTQNPTACNTNDGWIDILGSDDLATPLQDDETTSLAFLLSADAHASMGAALQQIDYGSQAGQAPLESFRQIPPRFVRALHQPPRGDHAARLARERESPEARLHRFLTAEFPTPQARDRALERLRADPAVVLAYASVPIHLYSDASTLPLPRVGTKSVIEETQDHLHVLGLSGAWTRAGGWGLIGILDGGIEVNHPELRSRTGHHSNSGNLVPGGNFLPYFSRNRGESGQDPANLDEAQASLWPGGENCNPGGGGWVFPRHMGHGTHVAGLAGANALDGIGVRGSCVNCGLSIQKITYASCDQIQKDPPEFDTFVNPIVDTYVGAAAVETLKLGMQVLSMSFGRSNLTCNLDQPPPTHPAEHGFCSMLRMARANDVLIVAAAGNNLETIRFPASHPDVVGVGGSFMDGFTRWDESPGCPLSPSNAQCGSNFSSGNWKLELLAPAKSVTSTLYHGAVWHPDIHCGDVYGSGGGADGIGPCTGTSMSTPQIAGLFGLLRSIHPLAPRGEPFQAGSYGLRNVVAETASRPAQNLEWDTHEGFGVPNASKAVTRVLGTVRGRPAANRATPLFRLYGPDAQDYAAFATPQMAMAQMLYRADAYQSLSSIKAPFIEGAAIPQYPAFPNPAAGAARAAALILTTESRTPGATADPIPLYLLEKAGPGTNRDSILLASVNAVNAALALGYQYAGRQGFVHPACSPDPSCRPPGTERLHLACHPGRDDCAVFLDREQAAFAAAGYTAVLSGMSSSVLGLAYPVIDTDNDGLPDGLEHAIGTNPLLADSDDDTLDDGHEYPFAGIPLSDPCAGPAVQCPVPPDEIFWHGFE